MDRHPSLVLVLSLVSQVSIADSPRLDGANCRDYPWIREEACSAFEQLSAGPRPVAVAEFVYEDDLQEPPDPTGTWWGIWNRRTGYQTALLRGQSSPDLGFHFSTVSESDVEFDLQTRREVERYVRRRLGEYAPLFGFRYQGHDLDLSGFQKQAPHAIPSAVVTSEGTLERLDASSPPTVVVRLVQLTRPGTSEPEGNPGNDNPGDEVRCRPILPIGAGGVTVVFREDTNQILSIIADYLPDPELVDHCPAVTRSEAIRIALDEIGLTAGELLRAATAEPFARTDEETLRFTWRVILDTEIPEPSTWLVDVDALTGDIANVAEESAAVAYSRSAVGSTFDQDALDELARDPSCPAAGCYDRYRAAEILVSLGHLDETRTDLHGRYVRVSNRSGSNATHDSGTYLFDPLLAGANCETDLTPPHVVCDVGPLRTEAENHHDEVSAYHHLTTFSHHLHRKYDWTFMSGIPVRVNAGNSWQNAKFKPNCSSFFGYFESCAPYITMGDGESWRPVEFEYPLDLFPVDWVIRRDEAKEADVVLHEFGHAILWKKGFPTGGGKFTATVHEGHADFFAADYLNQSVYGAWTRRTARFLDNELIFPQDLEPGFNPHRNGRIWSGALWDLRRRGLEVEQAGLVAGSSEVDAAQMAEDVSALAFYFGNHAPWSLDFVFSAGVVSPCTQAPCGFGLGLSALLQTDATKLGARYTYEILAAFASHGIQVEDPIAIIQPERLFVDGTSDTPPVSFRVFLGTNDAYAAIFSFNPAVVRGEVPAVFNPDIEGFNALLVLGGLGAGGDVEPLSPRSPAGTQQTAVITIEGSDFRQLVDASFILRNPVPVYSRVFTFSDEATRDDRDSYIEGAGQFIRGGDSPVMLYAVPPGSGCSCAISDGNPTRLPTLVMLLMLLALQRWDRRRACG